MKAVLSKTDVFGIVASSVCAVHCLATPLAMVTLPHVAGEMWESPLAHQICAGLVAVFCITAIIQGYVKHNDWKIVSSRPLAVGLLAVLTATFLLPEALHEIYETPVLCFGSFALVIGHILNIRKLAQCCANCEPEPAVIRVET